MVLRMIFVIKNLLVTSHPPFNMRFWLFIYFYRYMPHRGIKDAVHYIKEKQASCRGSDAVKLL